MITNKAYGVTQTGLYFCDVLMPQLIKAHDLEEPLKTARREAIMTTVNKFKKG